MSEHPEDSQPPHFIAPLFAQFVNDTHAAFYESLGELNDDILKIYVFIWTACFIFLYTLWFSYLVLELISMNFIFGCQ